ncbi:MAG: hypothetical protein CFK52_01990 [Chloracidobacterium sp. CP2_5A]|nr:MAG: hypothetical protein CFK52_01990 [Chloracidobacterium sp. CP2_5A]
MQCERCLEQLDAYLDGELDAGSAESLEAHLSRCPTCLAERRAREREQHLYRDLAATTSVPDGLWSRVAAGIAAVEARERRRAVTRPWSLPWLGGWTLGLAMAGLALAVIGLWAVWRPVAPAEPLVAQQAPSPADVLTDAPPASRAPSVSENTAPSDAVIIAPPRSRAVSAPTRTAPVIQPMSEAERLLRQTEQTYLTVIERLQAQVRRRRSQLDLGTRAAVDQMLVTLDAKIEEAREAARQSPTDPAALHFLVAVYRKKAEMLSEIVVMTEE